MSRRRIYLLRHGQVAYFDERGRPARDPDDVPLTAAGRDQARAAHQALAGVRIDRVVTSGLRRTVETARIIAPEVEPEPWPELREVRGGRLSDIPDEELEDVFTRAFRGVVAPETRFLGGETIGSLVDRVVAALDRLVADPGWDTTLAVLHGGVNRVILSYALTGERRMLGGLEQAPACVNVLDVGQDWIVRAVNTVPYDPAHASGRATTMEGLLEEYLPYRRAGGQSLR